MHKLIIEDDEGKTTVVPLIRDEITIGRKEGNTIRLTERNVSRRHARLTKNNGHVYIEDLQSYNGIKVNGDRIAGRAAINEGDRIQIGDYQLALKLDKSAPPPEAASAPLTPVATSITVAPTSASGGEARPAHDGQGSGEPGTVSIPAAASPAVRAAPQAPTQANPVLQARPDSAGAAAASAGAATGDRPARLVVVSSNFAGTEFKLDKPALVIGRTNDSDLVIDHRSISRQHARIYLDNGRYHVEDLKSANGVRVNGEEYGKVELRKGDFIDLGHVRLRFVGPNEDFVFSRDAQVVDVDAGGAAGGKSKMTLIAAVVGGLVVLLGAVAIVKMLGSGKGEGGKASVEVEARLDKINAEVDRAMKAEEWPHAVELAAQGLTLDGNQAVLRDKKARAEAEKKNQAAYDKYSKAAKDNNYEEAVSHYQEIPDNSVYRDKAQVTWGIIKSAYIKDHLAQARPLQAAGKCEEARKHVESVLFIDEGNTDAQDLARKCGQPAPVPRPHVAASPRAEKDPTSRSASAPVAHAVAPAPTPARPAAVEKEAPAVAPAGGGDDEERLVKDALDDYVHGNYTTAIDKARKANKGGSNSKAWRVIGASSCFLHDKPGAVSAWNKLSTMDRKFLQYVCQRNSIALP